jgi:hypothetical protein
VVAVSLTADGGATSVTVTVRAAALAELSLVANCTDRSAVW